MQHNLTHNLARPPDTNCFSSRKTRVRKKINRGSSQRTCSPNSNTRSTLQRSARAAAARIFPQSVSNGARRSARKKSKMGNYSPIAPGYRLSYQRSSRASAFQPQRSPFSRLTPVRYRSVVWTLVLGPSTLVLARRRRRLPARRQASSPSFRSPSLPVSLPPGLPFVLRNSSFVLVTPGLLDNSRKYSILMYK